MKKLQIVDAPKQERIIWREIMRSPESRYDHRLHGLLFISRGMSCYETAAVWGKSPRTMEYWVKRFEESGLNGLWERSRSGRPGSLGGSNWERLRMDLNRPPKDFGYRRRHWTGPLLKRRLAEGYGVGLSLRQCQRLLKKAP